MKCTWIARLALTLGLFLQGCGQREDAAVVEAYRRIHEFHDSLTVWCPTVRLSRDNIAGTIGGWISSVSNANRRAELALELSNILLSVDITNQPYCVLSSDGCRFQPKNDVVSFYGYYIDATCRIMRANGCSPEVTMEFFFKALQKYKAACFGISLTRHRLQGESHEDCHARRCCAMSGQYGYEQEMFRISRFVLPRLSDYLPEELHEEFRRRIKPFFDFPSRSEFYELMHPGYKYPLPSSSKPPAKKEAPTNVEDVVEVDI